MRSISELSHNGRLATVREAIVLLLREGQELATPALKVEIASRLGVVVDSELITTINKLASDFVAAGEPYTNKSGVACRRWRWIPLASGQVAIDRRAYPDGPAGKKLSGPGVSVLDALYDVERRLTKDLHDQIALILAKLDGLETLKTSARTEEPFEEDDEPMPRPAPAPKTIPERAEESLDLLKRYGQFDRFTPAEQEEFLPTATRLAEANPECSDVELMCATRDWITAQRPAPSSPPEPKATEDDPMLGEDDSDEEEF